MAYPYREKPTEVNNKPAQSSTVSEADRKKLAELSDLLVELRTTLRENRDVDDVLMANLENWTDIVAETLTESFVAATIPIINEEKQELEKIHISINSLKDEVATMKKGKFDKFKSFLFWVSCAFNIVLGGFITYLLLSGQLETLLNL